MSTYNAYSYNNFFGWVSNYKLPNHHKFGGSTFPLRTPFPPIIRDPTLKQVLFNWNLADTGATLFGVTISYCLALITSRATKGPLHNRRWIFNSFFNIMFTLSVMMGLTNSYQRLTGSAPNGLQWDTHHEEHLNQFDFSSSFLKKTPWHRVIEYRYPKVKL